MCQTRYFESPQVIAENTVPSPEMVGMITSVLVKTAPERDDSETRTVSTHTHTHTHTQTYTDRDTLFYICFILAVSPVMHVQAPSAADAGMRAMIFSPADTVWVCPCVCVRNLPHRPGAESQTDKI